MAWLCTVDGFHAELGSDPTACRLLGLIPDRSHVRVTSESIAYVSTSPDVSAEQLHTKQRGVHLTL